MNLNHTVWNAMRRGVSGIRRGEMALGGQNRGAMALRPARGMAMNPMGMGEGYGYGRNYGYGPGYGDHAGCGQGQGSDYGAGYGFGHGYDSGYGQGHGYGEREAYAGVEGAWAREEICRLMEYFPRLRAEEVPREAWAMARRGEDLTLSYCLCRMGQLEEMLKRRNRSEMMSTGSVSSMGSGEGTLAAFWDAYEV